MNDLKLTFYSKENCPLCEKGLAVLEEIRKEISFELEVVDIYQDDVLLERYQIMIPVVAIGNEELDYGILSLEKIKVSLFSKLT